MASPSEIILFARSVFEPFCPAFAILALALVASSASCGPVAQTSKPYYASAGELLTGFGVNAGDIMCGLKLVLWPESNTNEYIFKPWKI